MSHPVDTIVYDAAKIAQYQSDKRYDYNSQLQVQLPKWNPIELAIEWLSEHLKWNTPPEQIEQIAWWILILLFVVAVCLVVYFLVKTRPELFKKEKKLPLAYEVIEENIYAIDFEKELTEALATNNFTLAIRIVYLQTLRYLADQKAIDWQIYKTPTEYTYELKAAHLKAPFRTFTNHFLHVRYGNLDAGREGYEWMRTLQEQLQKGGSNE